MASSGVVISRAWMLAMRKKTGFWPRLTLLPVMVEPPATASLVTRIARSG